MKIFILFLILSPLIRASSSSGDSSLSEECLKHIDNLSKDSKLVQAQAVYATNILSCSAKASKSKENSKIVVDVDECDEKSYLALKDACKNTNSEEKRDLCSATFNFKMKIEDNKFDYSLRASLCIPKSCTSEAKDLVKELGINLEGFCGSESESESSDAEKCDIDISIQCGANPLIIGAAVGAALMIFLAIFFVFCKKKSAPSNI